MPTQALRILMIEVEKKGNGTAGGATVTINGVKTNIPSEILVVGTAGTKTLEQLKIILTGSTLQQHLLPTLMVP